MLMCKMKNVITRWQTLMITSFRSKDKEDGDNEQDCVKYRA
jgi:hypothetical protein